MTKFKIAITINYLAIGGTQTFAFSLAQALSNLGHNVVVYDFNLPFHTNSIKNLNSPLLESKDFGFEQYSIPLPLFLYKKLIKFRFIEIILTWLFNYDRVNTFRKYLKRQKINIVSSHLMGADTLSAFALTPLKDIIHCATMHGSYEGFQKAALKKKREKVFARVNGIAYLTKKNIAFLDHLKNKNPRLQIRQIYNGYLPAIFKDESQKDTRETLGIKNSDFVFIEVARGAKDKGWDEAINAFLDIKSKTSKGVKLLLVGDGEHLSLLKNQYSDFHDIIFYGYSGNPLPLIELSDAGLLPSYYAGESLPNTVIEYIFSGKPVLASDIGEISNMIGANSEQPCGFTFDLVRTGKVNEKEFSAKMLEYIENKDLYSKHVANTKVQRQKFSMENCAFSYQQFFTDLKKEVN